MCSEFFKSLCLLLIRLYQWTIRPLIGEVCRFHPSCSVYGYSAIEKYGALKGAFLTLKRLLKCHPWHPGGSDPLL